MYQEHLLKLYKDPAFRRKLSPEEVVAHQRNPACGDDIALGMKVEGGRITEICHHSQACSVTLASARAMCGAVQGLDVESARDRLRDALAFFAGEGGGAGGWDKAWGAPDLPALGDVRAFPMRMACVRLPWEALQEALDRLS